jgi:HlyD family secretion protein
MGGMNDEEENRIKEKAPSKANEEKQSPDRLNQMIVITTRKTWIALWTLAAIVFIVLLWSIFGSIPLIVEGKGVVISSAGLFTVQSRSDGTLKKFFISPGQAVKSGSLIAEIDDPELDHKLQSSKIIVKDLENQFDILQDQIAKENEAFQLALKSDLSAKIFSQQNQEKDLQKYVADYETKKELYKQGLLSLTQLMEIEHAINQYEINLANTKAEIEDIKAKLKKGYRQEELVSKKEELNKAKIDVQLLEITSSFTKVFSPNNGNILGLLVNEGDQVKRGESLVWAEIAQTAEPAQSYSMYAFVSVGDAKSVSIGDPVQIDLSNISKQRFGSLMGNVKEVSQFAASAELLTQKINNASLIKYLMGDNVAVALVIIDLIRDPKTPTGFVWTSGIGPTDKITTGSVGKIKIVSGNIRPIFYILPIYHLKYIQTRFGNMPYFERQEV